MSNEETKKFNEMVKYGNNLSSMVVYEYELLLIRLRDSLFEPSALLKQNIIDAVDGEYYEKTKKRYEYYKGLVEKR